MQGKGPGLTRLCYIHVSVVVLHTQVNTEQDMPEHNVYVPSRKRMARVCVASHPQNIQFLLPRANSYLCNSHTVYSNQGRLGASRTSSLILTPRTTQLLQIMIKKEEKLGYLEFYLSSSE